MPVDEKRPLGSILLQRKLLEQEELNTALEEQRRGNAVGQPAPLASHLIERGLVSELEALRALSEQQGVPGIDLSQVAILLDHLDVVPRSIAESHSILPVLVRGDRIFLAMCDPSDKRVIDELEFVTGKKVFPYVSLRRTLERATALAYDGRERGETYYVGPNVPKETLRQLGIKPATTTASPVPEAPPSYSPAVVLDTQMTAAGEEAEMSTADFGQIEEASIISRAPIDTGAHSTRTSAVTSKLVLIVDDEDDIRRLLVRLLTDRGLRVLEASRGLQALRLVKEHMPDLIILDAMLPELHGFDIARRIKDSAKYGHIPIVMISAVYRGWRIAEDLKSGYGIQEYLEKPFRIGDAIAAIDRALTAGAQASQEAKPREEINAAAENALEQGIASYRDGRIDEAIGHLRRGVDLDPLAYRLHFHLALLYGKKGLIYEGIQALERAVDLSPKHFPALKNLAVLYEKAGFRHKAIEAWERSVHVAPDEETAATIKQHLLKLL